MGVWADPKTWKGDGVPSSLDAVHISDSPVNVQQDAEAQGVIIEGSMVKPCTHTGGCAVYITAYHPNMHNLGEPCRHGRFGGGW